jgi:hypothetical protein
VGVTLTPLRRAVFIACVCSILWAPALAHIGPSERANNRYVKLTLFGDRARLLYTYYVGDVPGRGARARMDANRDRALAEDEASAFGAEVGATVAAHLEVTVDGQRVPIEWRVTDVGLGTPAVDAGSLSVDLVTWLCFDSSRASHDVVVFDHWLPPDPGETEVRIEESPGVSVSRSTFGSDGQISQLHFVWAEATGPRPLDAQGLYLSFDVDAARADMHGAECAAAPTAAQIPPRRERNWLAYAAIAAGIAVAVAAALALALARRTT